MLIGHKTQWELLKELYEKERLPHGIIFSGLNSLGKKKVALEMIKLITGEGEKGESSETSKIEENTHPDLHLLFPKNREIQISQIRDLQKALNLKPREAPFKFALIDRAENLNAQAQNCLLKTLEEPKGDTLIILITSQPESLFKTIKSRCQTVKFYPVPFSEIKEAFNIEEKKLRKMFEVSGGRPGKIKEWSKNSNKFNSELTLLSSAEEIFNSALSDRISKINQLFTSKKEEREILGQFLEAAENYFRLLLLRKNGIETNLSFTKQNNRSIIEISSIVNQIQRLKFLSSRTNINPKLALEDLVINYSNF